MVLGDFNGKVRDETKCAGYGLGDRREIMLLLGCLNRTRPKNFMGLSWLLV